MEAFANLVSSIGFPIACVIAMGYFIYIAFNKFMAKSEKREEKLYEMLGETQLTNEKLLETNASFVGVLEKYNADLTGIKADVSDIKDFLDLNKRASDK